MKLSALLLAFTFAFLFACKVDNKSKAISQPYIISKEDSLSKRRWKNKGMPPPPFLIYGDYNFVVDTAGNVFLHRKSYPLGFYDTPIDFSNLASIDLDTTDLVSMNQQDIENFLAKLPSSWDTENALVIAGFGDTIKTGLIYQLIDSLRAHGTIKQWNIRKVTKEETAVLNAKNARR